LKRLSEKQPRYNKPKATTNKNGKMKNTWIIDENRKLETVIREASCLTARLEASSVNFAISNPSVPSSGSRDYGISAF